VVPVNAGHLLYRSTAGQIALHHHALQRRSGALELWQDEMQLTGRGVGEHQQHFVAQLVADQPRRRVHLHLAHPVRALDIQRNVHNAHAVQHGDALGGFGQHYVGGSTGQADLARSSVEVQRFYEQAPDCVSPAI